ELIGREKAPLDELLRTPFARSGEEKFAPADLWQLTSLPLYTTKRLAQGSPGCGGRQRTQGPPSQPQVRQAPGCRCQNFGEREYKYFRLDCYSYAPQKEGTGAELRIEMRLVYQSAPRMQLD